MKTLREDPSVRVRDKQAIWKLLSKISRTAPACITCVCERVYEMATENQNKRVY